MPIHARLLILGKDMSSLNPLATELDRLGLKTVTATELAAACMAVEDLNLEAALIGQDALSEWPQIGAQLAKAAEPRRLPLMLFSQDGTVPDGFDIVFKPPVHAQQIILSTEHLIRASIAEEELDTRLQLLKKTNKTSEIKKENAPALSVLSVGQPDPDFLALNHALRSQSVDIVAALTSYSAFDYLHDKTFDAVLLWAGDNPSDAMSIASGMRRNTRLYHTPALLRLTKPAELDVAEAFMRGINDIADAHAPIGDVGARLMQLATLHRRHMNVRKALEEMRNAPEMDTGTGLFGRNLFAAHLSRLAKASVERRRPLSVCVLRVSETPEITRARQRKRLDKALPQVGSMINRLIRTEDSGGRLSNEVFALALPATTVEMARQVGERIAAVIGCTAFDGGQGIAPFVIELDAGVAQLRPEEDPAAALARAADDIKPPQSFAS